jgi:hypothetical protein
MQGQKNHTKIPVGCIGMNLVSIKMMEHFVNDYPGYTLGFTDIDI